MIKTLTNLFKQDKEKFVVPKGVQDVIPVAAIFDDGIFKVGKDKYSKTYRFTDINYAVASREHKGFCQRCGILYMIQCDDRDNTNLGKLF